MAPVIGGKGNLFLRDHPSVRAKIPFHLETPEDACFVEMRALQDNAYLAGDHSLHAVLNGTAHAVAQHVAPKHVDVSGAFEAASCYGRLHNWDGFRRVQAQWQWPGAALARFLWRFHESVPDVAYDQETFNYQSLMEQMRLNTHVHAIMQEYTDCTGAVRRTKSFHPHGDYGERCRTIETGQT